MKASYDIRGAGLRFSVPALILGLATLAPPLAAATIGPVTWSGGAGSGNPYWNIDANWAGNEAPSNPTPGTVSYGADGQDVTGELETDRQVGGLSLPNADDISHALNLGGRTLTVAGTLQNDLRGGVFDLTNGTLRIGTDTVEGNLLIGGASGAASPAITILRAGMIFDPYRVQTLRLGRIPTTHINNQNARLDLRGVTIAGGNLVAYNILLHAHYRQADGSYIAIDATTGIDAIVASNQLIVGRGEYGGRIYIGDPSDPDRRFPANVRLRVGVGPGQRGELEVGSLTGGSAAAAIALSASLGGDIVAYLTDLTVMKYTGTGTAALNGTLDLAAMTNGFIDTLRFEVGVDHSGRPDADVRGVVRLPAGALTAGTVVLGGELCLGYGRVFTSNTLVTVTNALTLNTTGAITIDMGASPIGWDIDGAFIDAGGSIHVNFLAAPAAPGVTNWAFRVNGDAYKTLSAMAGDGRLTSDGTYAGWKTGVLYDGVHTCYAMVDEATPFSPVAVARDASFEIEPSGTVRVDISEVDAGSYDPDGRTPVAVTMSRDGAGGPFDTNLSFNAVNDHPVMVRITVGDPVVDADSDSATVSIGALDPGSAANRTWLGEASTVLMDRREWWWKGNWFEGTPPSNPTPATITFGQYGEAVQSVLEQDRQIGGLTVPSGRTHTLDLGGKTLTIAGTFRPLWRLDLTNGTVRVGSETVVGQMNIGTLQGVGTLTWTRFYDGAVLDLFRVDTMHLGNIPPQHVNDSCAALDLRGGAVAGGVLRARHIRLNCSYRNAAGTYIGLDQSTGMHALAVSNELVIGTGSRGGLAFIGNPADADRRLPPGIDIRIGAGPEVRGRLHVGRNSGVDSAQNATAILSASGGGTFEADLEALKVVPYEADYSATMTQPQVGTLDLAAMTACRIDTETFVVARNASANADANPRGTVRLPPGSVTAGTVEIGAAIATGFGRLEMSNTVFTVTNTLTLNKTAQIRVSVGAEPSGLILTHADPGALNLDPEATLTVIFLAPAVRRPHYGLRLAGDHAAALQAMRETGRLVIDDAGLQTRSALIFHSVDGYTYVGLPMLTGSAVQIR